MRVRKRYVLAERGSIEYRHEEDDLDDELRGHVKRGGWLRASRDEEFKAAATKRVDIDAAGALSLAGNLKAHRASGEGELWLGHKGGDVSVLELDEEEVVILAQREVLAYDDDLELTLEEGKPVVLQGRDGLSQKGTEPGNASYYYSLTRIPARGTVGRYRQAYVYIHGACGTQVEPGWLPAAAAIDWSIPGERIGDRLKGAHQCPGELTKAVGVHIGHPEHLRDHRERQRKRKAGNEIGPPGIAQRIEHRIDELNNPWSQRFD
jgi:hypothetical protein